jgi:hypothetical protein
MVEKESTPHYASRIVWTILGIVETVLALRFILKLIAANPAAGFTDFIYSASSPLIQPFLNVVRNVRADASGGTFEWNTLIAMLAYWLLAWVIVRLFFLGTNTDRVDFVSRP